MIDRAEYSKAYYLANKERIVERSKDYKLANKEKVAENNKAYYEANKEKRAEIDKAYRRTIKHKKKYGITLDECISQFGTSCNNCGRTPVEGERVLCTDHCHKTGVVRGRLCHSCNTSIGRLGDTVEALERVVRYLKGEN